MQMNRTLSRLASMVAAAAALILAGCQVTPPSAAKDQRPSEERLFNGRDLKGWAGVPDHWTVEDGAITGFTTALNPIKNNTFLIYTNGVVDNFELRFQYRVFNGNSGVQYRSQVLDVEKAIVGGYQADIEAGNTYSGILYEERGRGILALRGQRTVIAEQGGQTKVNLVGELAKGPELQAFIRQDDWNEYLIVANGNHFMHFINNKLMVDVVDNQSAKAAKSGVLAFQIHVGPPMKVQFKDVVLKRLP